jgi:hypothetical protein
VDREANAFAIAQTMQWREEALQSVSMRAKERLAIQLAATIAWLDIDNTCGQHQQEDILDKLITDCCPGTTEWILKHQKMKNWLKDGSSSPTLWIKGKPGCGTWIEQSTIIPILTCLLGKSTLCAKIVHFLRAGKRSTLLFCFYSYRSNGTLHRPSGFIFAMLLSQILRQNRNLSAYVYEDFVAGGQSPSVQNLKALLNLLLPQIKSPRIIVDGIDECIHCDASGNPQDLGIIKEVVEDILQLETITNSTSVLKLLVSSRDISQVAGKLSKKPVVALDHETDHMRSAIRTFTNHRFSDIRGRFDNLSNADGLIDSLKDKIVVKSQGKSFRQLDFGDDINSCWTLAEMFLWARLVLMQIEEDAFAVNDLETAIMDMPASLNDL